MSNFPFCDMHTHILPGMDDGSADPAMSVSMLRRAMEQGIGQVFATPHYYPVESVSDFLSRRDQAAQRLLKAMEQQKESLPRICLGAEVAYRPGIGYEEDLDKLRLGRSEYLLLELPFAPWGKDVLRDIRNMVCARGITPVLAHLERYLPMQKKQMLYEVLGQGVLVQMNAEALLHWRTRGTARRMLLSDTVHVLGSDCHNLSGRAPNMGQALQELSKIRGMARVLERLSFISMDIFEQAQSLQ